MAYKLKLTRSELQNVDYQYLGAFRLRIDVADRDNSGTDPNVFIYRRDPVNPYSGLANDTFFAVCSPPDMSEFPVGEPDPNKPFPFFRLNYVEVDLRSTTLVERVWAIIVREIDQLLQGLTRMEQLVVVQEVDVGPLTTTGDSESASESESAG